MATIGTFKKTGTEYTGEIFTLSLQAKGVRLVPDLRASGENAPSHRVLVGRAEIGAAWTKTSNEGRAYLGLKLETVSRCFSKLQDDGVLSVRQRQIRVLDSAALQKVVAGASC